MKKTLALLLFTAFAFAYPALADGLPSHYPPEGFNRTGTVDAVSFADNTVIINDIPHRISKSAIVHSLTIKNVSLARVRPGILVAFRMGDNQEIEEFWLLPANYNRSGRR